MGGHVQTSGRTRFLRRWIAAVGALVVGGLAVVPSTADAVPEPGGINKPPLTGQIISFPQRDFVSATGWAAYAAVDVEVWRPNPAGGAGDFVLVGVARDVDPDATGLLEVNHPGGACWGPLTPGVAASAVTPNIKAGDRIRLSAKNAIGGAVVVTDQTTTADVVITQFASAISANTVELRGTALQENGSPMPLAQLEVRLIGGSKDRFAINNKRDLRAPRDGNLTIDAVGNWVATIPGLSPADMSRALAAENRVIWLGSNPAGGTESTIFEAGDLVAPGPQAPCTAPLQGAVATTSRSSIEFPATTIATASAPEVINVGNAGVGALVDLHVSSVSFSGDADGNFGITAEGCTTTAVTPGGAPCSISVVFHPATTGIKSAVLNILSDAGNTLVPVTATGLGTDVGEEIAFGLPTPGAMGFGTRSVGITTPNQTLTIRNIGNIPMGITGAAIVGGLPGEFVVAPGGSCAGASVIPGATCTYLLNFTPQAEGDRTAELQVSSNASLVEVELTGGGLISGGVIDPPPPPISLGVFAARDFVSVEGFTPGETLTMQIIRHGVVVGTSTDTLVGDDGIAEVNHPGGDCWDAVTPNIRAGDILRVTRNADGRAYQTTTADVKITQHAQETFPGSNIVEFKGYARDLVTGLPLPMEQLETRMIATSADPFQINGRRAVNSATDGTLVFDTVANPDGTRWTSTYDFTSSPNPAHDVQLAIDNENRMLWLGRDPLALFELTFWEDGDAVANGPSAPCTAPGEADSAGITISPSTQTFPQLTTSETADRTFTVRNIGTAPLTVDSVTFGGTDPGDFSRVGALPGPIAPGGTGTITVRFQPTGTGPRAATVRVNDNAVGSPHSATVTGTGVASSTPSILVTPGALTFPDTQVGTGSAALAVTVTNEGGAPLTFTGFAIGGLNAGDYDIDTTSGGRCTLATSLATNATCTVSVVFTPGAVNTRAATLSISTNDPGTPTAVVGLTGTATTTAAGVSDPPRAGHVIEAFPVRDYVAVSGYAPGDFVRIELYRDDVLVGRSQPMGVIDTILTDTTFDGFAEVNHLGGVCWSNTGGANFTPDILPGDVVRAVLMNPVGPADISADQIHVGDLDVSIPVTQTAPDTVVLSGTAFDPFSGAPLSFGSIEPRITSVGAAFEVNGKRDIRAGAGLQGLVTMVGGRWTATFSGLSANDVATALAGDGKVLWMGRNPGALNELTHWEWNEIPGPDPSCAGSPLTVSAPTLNAPSMTFSFGGVGVASSVQSVFFAVPAGDPTNVTPTSLAFEGPNAGDFAVAPTSTCGAALAPGLSCRIDVVFTAGALGQRLASLKITHDGANHESFLPVAGTGVSAPTITLVNPASVGHGGTVVLTGTNLASTTSVLIGGNAAAFTVVSDTQVQAIVPTNPLLVGAATVRIDTVAGFATSTMNVLPDPPTIGGVAPASAKVGDGVTITGTNLAGAAVTFNGVNAVVGSNDGSTLTTTVPAGATTGTLRVITAGGAATTAFTVIPAPSVTGFTPTTAKAGSVITINGANFTNTSTVTFSTTGAPLGVGITFVSATQLRVTVPAAAVQGPVTVTSNGQSGSAVFTVERAPSTISLAPATGPIGSNVTINGFNFLQTSKVSFGGKNATFVIVSDRVITATVPSGATTGVVSVNNKWGSANGPTYTIITAPTVTSFTPGTASKTVPAPAGTVVTVTGTGFATASSVTLGQGLTAVNVPGFVIVNATTIRFNVPATAANGLYTIRVTNPAGTGSSVAVLTVVN